MATKTKQLRADIDEEIYDKVTELQAKYHRQSKREIIERMLTVTIELEEKGKVVL